MYELKKVNTASSARVWSVIFGLLYLLFAAASLSTGRGGLSPNNAVVTVVVGIIIFTLAGAALGALVAFIYNLVASKWGGVRLDFRLVEEEEAPATRQDSKEESKEQ